MQDRAQRLPTTSGKDKKKKKKKKQKANKEIVSEESMEIEMASAHNFGSINLADDEVNHTNGYKKRTKGVSSGPEFGPRSRDSESPSPSVPNGQGSTDRSSKSGSSKGSMDSAAPPSDTTELDIIINAGSRKAAVAMIERLTASAIDFALKAYGVEESAHILLEATLQCDFPRHPHPALQIHQLSAHASTAVLQSLCRRRADQHTYRRKFP